MKKIFQIATVFMVMQTLHAADCSQEECCNWCDSSRFSASAEFLYWDICHDKLDYAITQSNIDDDGSPENAKVHFLSYDWEPAFRVAIGYQTSCDCWNASVQYTHLYARASSSVAKSEAVRPILFHASAASDLADEARGFNKLDYDLFDLRLQRTFCLSSCTSLSPHFGFRTACIDQKLKVEYIGAEFTDSTPPTQIRNYSNTKGYGIHAGLTVQTQLHSCLGIYGRMGGSLLAGTTDLHRKISSSDSREKDNDANDEINSIKEKHCQALPCYQIGSGITYETSYGCCSSITLALGYEFTHWFHTPNVRRFFDDVQESTSLGIDGYLMFHGVTAGISATF